MVGVSHPGPTGTFLEEQKALDEPIELNEEIAHGNLKELYVTDGTGDHWKISGEALKKLLEDLHKHVDLSSGGPPQ
jgi:hypothetical protein